MYEKYRTNFRTVSARSDVEIYAFRAGVQRV